MSEQPQQISASAEWIMRIEKYLPHKEYTEGLRVLGLEREAYEAKISQWGEPRELEEIEIEREHLYEQSLAREQ